MYACTVMNFPKTNSNGLTVETSSCEFVISVLLFAIIEFNIGEHRTPYDTFYEMNFRLNYVARRLQMNEANRQIDKSAVVEKTSRMASYTIKIIWILRMVGWQWRWACVCVCVYETDKKECITIPNHKLKSRSTRGRILYVCTFVCYEAFSSDESRYINIYMCV